MIERLSADLMEAHPDMRGLSVRNLRYMAALATRWPSEIVQCSFAQLPWGLVATLLDNCPDLETLVVYGLMASPRDEPTGNAIHAGSFTPGLGGFP